MGNSRETAGPHRDPLKFPRALPRIWMDARPGDFRRPRRRRASMRWHDRVYGDVAIEEPGILDLIGSPTFERLKGVRQAGPSALTFPFKNVTRFEHSLGVFLLLRRLGADRREQVAGLLHDISHTAFSHAVDFVISSE